MTNIAIIGHKTRGKEVIEILEMLGGENLYSKSGYEDGLFYYLSDEQRICSLPISESYRYFILFTIEEFLKKFPYKVGDKVIDIKTNRIVEIYKAHWSESNNCTYYDVKRPDNTGCVRSYKFLQPYKEETMEERKYADLRLDVDQDDKLATEATIDGNKITPPENYLIGKITQVDNGMLVEFVKKQSQFPKTHEECCTIMGFNSNTLKWNNFFNINKDTHPYIKHFDNLIENFCKLLICRDAYWKIAGKKIGLGKPWKPNWTIYEHKFCLGTDKDKVIEECVTTGNRILAFPTKEMRDAFKENFDDDIEFCKEFL